MGKRILFIHHGGLAGGAPLSMLYTMQGMHDAGYDVLAALVKPSTGLHALYNTKGFSTIEVPWIPIFITWSGSEGKWYNPVMWKGVYDAWRSWKSAHTKLERLLTEERIDIVHLNSVSLSNPATLLQKIQKPFIWHVREHGPSHKGKRYNFLQEKLLTSDEVIFLSQAEKKSWLGTQDHGVVINNFVNFDQFDREISGKKYREELGIPENHPVVLYVGGKKKHKGIFELLDALVLVKKEFGENFTCLMPDSEVNINQPGKVGRKILNRIEQGGLSDNCYLLPFNPDIVDLFAASDLLVFPATKPHFARPVIEASAMGVPVIASDLKAIDELVVDGETGYLVDHSNIKQIADRITMLFHDPGLRKQMGEAGHTFAKNNFSYKSQIKKVVKVYDRIIQGMLES